MNSFQVLLDYWSHIQFFTMLLFVAYIISEQYLTKWDLFIRWLPFKKVGNSTTECIPTSVFYDWCNMLFFSPCFYLLLYIICEQYQQWYIFSIGFCPPGEDWIFYRQRALRFCLYDWSNTLFFSACYSFLCFTLFLNSGWP